MRDYSILNIIGNGISLLYTRIAFPKARLVRLPVYIRGKKGISYRAGLTTGHGCRIDSQASRYSLIIGKNARIGDYVHINADKMITIGDNVLIASKVFISDANHGIYKGDKQSSPYSNPSLRETVTDPVSIGNNVWIGENVVILAGSKIGNGCIIGANTLVNGGEYPDNTIIVGSPARIIKRYNDTTQKWEKYRNVGGEK